MSFWSDVRDGNEDNAELVSEMMIQFLHQMDERSQYSFLYETRLVNQSKSRVLHWRFLILFALACTAICCHLFICFIMVQDLYSSQERCKS
mmetsp:Transcript_13615/g.24425  ORF Transcript_13615/g.24425 Transcript_13615/m.24425 type:complete len:91 (+) Transcript_13615:1650-1922(+)